MKNLEINIPLTRSDNVYDFQSEIEVQNIRITTNDYSNLRKLGLILKFYNRGHLVFKQSILSSDKHDYISEIKFRNNLMADKLTIESSNNSQFSIIGLLNF
jgi:hypothetical protein